MAAVEPAGLDAVTRVVVSGTAADNAAERKKDAQNQRGGVHAHDAEKADVAVGQEEEDLNDDDGQQELGRSSTVDSQKLPYSKPRMVVLVLNVAGAAFLNTFNAQSSVIVLPTIGRDLNVPSSRQQWIVSAYSLTFACFLMMWGRLADVYGKKLLFVAGSAWLSAMCIILPFVKHEIGFDVIRGLQGMGAAANVPTAIGILGTTFPPGKYKNYAFAAYGAGAPMGSIFGNILGGVIAQYLDWQWVFWIGAMLAALCTVCGVFIIPSPPPPARTDDAAKLHARSAVDWTGGALVTVGLVILMFALTEGNVVGWATPWVPTLIVVSLIIIGLFVAWEHHLETRTSKRPLMKVSVFRNARFSAAMAIMFLFFASFSNYLLFATYFFQDYLGLSVIKTTLRFIPTGVAGILVAFTTAHMLAVVPGNYLLLLGTLALSVSPLLFAAPIDPHATYWAYGFPAMVLSVVGADIIYPCLTLFTAKSLPPEDQALGGALINSVGQVGRAIGLAIATAIQTAVMASASGVGVDDLDAEQNQKDSVPLLRGLKAAEWFNFAMALAAAAVTVVAFRGSGYIGRKH
ncbi:major facilitator superfamily domain-containing protein [Phyllosticta capitalensis]|uniref:major facilitator superfamily domain-containing protein n=1 Tax=Phyllosticta capitalensis TaxID=121624 RepID=UPI00312DADFC